MKAPVFTDPNGVRTPEERAASDAYWTTQHGENNRWVLWCNHCRKRVTADADAFCLTCNMRVCPKLERP